MGLWHNEREEQLRELGDARDGIEICLAKGAHAHNGENESHEHGGDGGVQRDQGAKDEVRAEDAESDREDKAEEDGAGGDELGGGRVVGVGGGEEGGDVGLGGGGTCRVDI